MTGICIPSICPASLPLIAKLFDLVMLSSVPFFLLMFDVNP